MGLFGSLVKLAVTTVTSPVVVVTDVLKGDFSNTSQVVENVINTTGEAVEDIVNGDLI